MTRVVRPLETSFWVSDNALPLCGIFILHPEKKLNPNIWLLPKYSTVRSIPQMHHGYRKYLKPEGTLRFQELPISNIQ